MVNIKQDIICHSLLMIAMAELESVKCTQTLSHSASQVIHGVAIIFSLHTT